MKIKNKTLEKLFRPLNNEHGFLADALAAGLFLGTGYLLFQACMQFKKESTLREFDCEHKCKLPEIIAECEHGGKSDSNMRYITYDLKSKVKGDKLIEVIKDSAKGTNYSIKLADDYAYKWSGENKHRAKTVEHIDIIKKNDWKDTLAGIAFCCTILGIGPGLSIIYGKKGCKTIIDEEKEYDSLTFELEGYGFYYPNGFFERNQKSFKEFLKKIDEKQEVKR